MNENQLREANGIVVRELRHAINLHDAGKYEELYGLFDQTVSKIDTLLDGSDKRIDMALTLLDCWSDSGGHEWLYYEGIGKDDWPRLAEEIVAAIESGEEITNPLILEHFVLNSRNSLWRGIKGLFTHE